MNIRILSKAVAAIALVTAFSSLPISAQQSRHAVPGHRYLKEYWNQPELYLEHQA